MVFPHALSWLIDNPLRRAIISPEEFTRRLSLRGDEAVLEVGPGSGYFSVSLARELRRGRLHLLDVQMEMLDKVRRKTERLGIDNVEFTRLDAGAAFPFPDSHFDLAVLVSVLGEVADQASCLASLHRVLRPDGVLAIHESVPDPDLIPFDVLTALVTAHGFVPARRFGGAYNYTALFSKS
jgi:ubiquinone/menaquinone biosynthesis C-methylase UbiE